MKEYTTRQKMVETVELTSTTCDLCGKKAYYNQEWSGGYDVAETEIRFKENTYRYELNAILKFWREKASVKP